MSSYQICSKCIMDTSDIDIYFDKDGVCNHCYLFDETMKKIKKDIPNKKDVLEQLIQKIKKEGKNKEYDCIAGVSGGVDSSYVIYKLKKLGLRTLVVHMDNGWDSELAVKNIENIVSKLDYDLYTNVLDWEEFKSLQVAYLKASVLDLEALSDHAIYATLYQQASKRNIKYIISGTNFATEAILPRSWNYNHKLTDVRNIKGIYKVLLSKKIHSFPTISFFRYLFLTYIKKIKNISLLNYLDYDKEKAKSIIINELGWKDYGGKHHESIITRFYQGYILPEKFKIDKRRAHLSNLIVAGQLSREQALEEIKKPTYDPLTIQQDLEYVPKKLGLTKKEFEDIMKLPIKSHLDYPNNLYRKKMIFKIGKTLKSILKWF